MDRVKVMARTIRGIQVRTANTHEMDDKTAKIAPLWQQFYTEIMPQLTETNSLYGVYHHYESDEHGEFNVLAGVELDSHNEISSTGLQQDKMVDVAIQTGDYLVFSGSGEMPQVVIDVWAKIWAFFDASLDTPDHEKPTYERAFTTDFEVYNSATDVDVYIAVK